MDEHTSQDSTKKSSSIFSYPFVIVGIILLTLLFAATQGYWTTAVKSFKNYRVVSSSNVPATQCPDSPADSDTICQWYFLNYTPSSWENYWHSNIKKFHTRVCETLAAPESLNNSVLTIERMMELQKFGRNKTESDRQSTDQLLSKMFYRQECTNQATKVSFHRLDVAQVIEPLIGLLRDPLTMCGRISSIPASAYEGAEVQSKRYFLLSIAAPIYIYPARTNEHGKLDTNLISNKRNPNLLPWMYQRAKYDLSNTELHMDTKRGQHILIDLGSSYFGSWGGDASAAAGRWFYEHYKRFGIKFDRILAYEASGLDVKAAWNQLPDDVFPVYTLINVPCATSGKFSPWETLKGFAKTYDHVVIKLDIDSPHIEGPLIKQLVNDASIHSLVDEMFFEHHVSVKEMLGAWGSAPGTLPDSYELFSKIRRLGIRMHSWP